MSLRARPKALAMLVVVDRRDPLDFEVVVARAERADLFLLALLGVIGDVSRLGPEHPAVLLDVLEVGAGAVALLDRPQGAAGEHLVHFERREPQLALAADSGRDPPGQHVGQFLLVALDLVVGQAGAKGPHAAGDVEADAAGRDDAAGVRIERRDAADGKAVAPMGVRHGVRGLHDPRQGRDVRRLLVDLLVHLPDQLLIREDDHGHPHPAERLDPPLGLGLLLQLLGEHLLAPIQEDHGTYGTDRTRWDLSLDSHTSTMHWASQLPASSFSTFRPA